MINDKKIRSGGCKLCGNEQDWQCTYNATLRRVRVTTVAVDEQ